MGEYIQAQTSLGKEVDDRIAKAADLAKRWNNRLARGISNLAENYLNGDIEGDARVRIKDRYRRARFKAIGRDAAKNFCCANYSFATEAGGVMGPGDQNRFSVFALLAEPIEGVQQIVPSFVWFEPLDDSADFGGEPSDLFLRPLFTESLKTVGNGEVNVSWFNGPVLFSERRSEEIKAIALRRKDSADVHVHVGRHVVNGLEFDNDSGAIWIAFMREGVGLSFEKDRKLSLEDCDLIIRPTDFSFWAGKSQVYNCVKVATAE